MGMFGGIKEARYTDGGSYVLEGTHRLEVLGCKKFTTKGGIPAFIIEFKVLESNNPKMTPGLICSHMIQIMAAFPSVGLGNISQFLQTALTKPDKVVGPEEITEEVCEFAADEKANPLKGTVVRAFGVQQLSKQKKQEFTKIKYFTDWDKTGAADAAKA